MRVRDVSRVQIYSAFVFLWIQRRRLMQIFLRFRLVAKDVTSAEARRTKVAERWVTD